MAFRLDFCIFVAPILCLSRQEALYSYAESLHVDMFGFFICTMSPIEQIKEPISSELERYIQLFDGVLQHKEDFMNQVLSHVRRRRGKMMRPILVLLLAKAFGEINSATLHSAVALELLHTSSLIHDDVVDESSERRGAPSLRKIYDNKTAVLLGDFMLAQTLKHSALTGHIEAVQAISKLGAMLSEGEILQLSNVGWEEISEKTYFDIISRKTAALFETCGELAALSTHASEQSSLMARHLGKSIGICFQIRDDIFDYYEDPSVGKPFGNDMVEGKLTLPVIHALKTTGSGKAEELAQKVKSGDASPEERAWLIDFAKQNGGIAHARETMDRICCEARELVRKLSHREIQEALLTYIDFVVGRNL